MSEVVGIVAVGSNGVIGADQDIPWRIPEDWRRFKALTMGQVLIMGRRTYESIGRPLPGRTIVVVTRDESWQADGVQVALSVSEAFARAESLALPRIFVAGGGEIYRAAWDRLDRLEVTEVDQAPSGDVTFPSIEPEDWQEVRRQQQDGFAYVSYLRRPERY
jgi:dihydrofolate reductase